MLGAPLRAPSPSLFPVNPPPPNPRPAGKLKTLNVYNYDETTAILL